MSQVTAITAIIVYSVTTFQKFDTFTNPYMPPILLATTVIFGSLISSYLADKLGRKCLNCLSLILTACGLFVTALFYYLNLHSNFSSYAWVPVASLSLSIFVASCGIVPLGLICSVEILPTKVRTKLWAQGNTCLAYSNNFLRNISDSYRWNGNSLFYAQSHHIYIRKNVSKTPSACRFAWLLSHLCSWLCFVFLFRSICIG